RQLVGGVGVARHHLGVEALLAGLAHDQPDIGVVAADIDQVDLGVLQAGDQRRVVLLAGRKGLVERLGDALAVQLLLGLVGQPFAVGALVVQDGDALAAKALGDEVAGDHALLVIAAAGAEDVGPAFLGRFLGQRRIGRGRRDLKDAGFVVD